MPGEPKRASVRAAYAPPSAGAGDGTSLWAPRGTPDKGAVSAIASHSMCTLALWTRPIRSVERAHSLSRPHLLDLGAVSGAFQGAFRALEPRSGGGPLMRESCATSAS
jgi:hypothetical protein